MSTRASSLASSLALVFTLVTGCDSPPPMQVDAAVLPDAFVGDDAWTMPDAGFVIADHGPSYVIPDQGGTRIVHPELVLITYANDPNRATLEAHARWLVGSSWLTDVGAEYGIGTGSVLATIHRTDDAPPTTTTAEIEALLQAGVTDRSLPPGSDNSYANVLYVIYFPIGTTITDSDLGTSCVSYGGYHTEISNGGNPFAYAVIPTCHDFNPALTDIETEEEAMTHELIEAATDARPMTHPAFAFTTSFPYSPWLFVGAELADLCALHVGPTAYVRDPSGFVASRVWSNAAAMANDRDPCVPIPAAAAATPYYQVSIAPGTAQVVTPGTSVTFDLTAWSTGPMGPFGIYAEAATAGAGMFMPTVSVDRMTVRSGDHATLTVGVPVGTPSQAYTLIYVETYLTPSDYNSQPVVVFAP